MAPGDETWFLRPLSRVRPFLSTAFLPSWDVQPSPCPLPLVSYRGTSSPATVPKPVRVLDSSESVLPRSSTTPSSSAPATAAFFPPAEPVVQVLEPREFRSEPAIVRFWQQTERLGFSPAATRRERLDPQPAASIRITRQSAWNEHGRCSEKPVQPTERQPKRLVERRGWSRVLFP